MFRAVPPPIIRSKTLYIQLQVLSTVLVELNELLLNVCMFKYLLVFHITLSLQLTIPEAVCIVCAPDDGRRNRLKHIEHL